MLVRFCSDSLVAIPTFTLLLPLGQNDSQDFSFKTEAMRVILTQEQQNG